MASNQVEAYRKARDAYNEAVRTNQPKETLAALKADRDAKKALAEGTGASVDGGIFS